jgi:glycosyltransferase involved in cell wall biosynthesis
MRFSICIPTWEQHGFGLEYLKDLLLTIGLQTFQDYEIVISDHSKSEEISDYVLGRDKLVYVRNELDYGNGVANLNNCLKYASGEIIKIMFQDDVMFSSKCLEEFDAAFSKRTEWAVCGCNHTRDMVNFYQIMIPSWGDRLADGVNTISSPSVLAIRNEDIEFFDEKLTMMMDIDYYLRMHKRQPMTIIPDCLITNRQHPHQISSRYSSDLGAEVMYIKEKMRYSL